jgi:hypothetical protein
VDVSVRFPEGVITETFPAPKESQPAMADEVVFANGQARFSVDVLAEKQGNLPKVASDNIYAHARNVDSQLVRSGGELEKFIFYRGLGRFQPRLSITSNQGALTLDPAGSAAPQASFLVHVDQFGQAQMLNLGRFTGAKTVSTDVIEQLRRHSPGAAEFLTGAGAHDALVDALNSAGLRKDEAAAMVNTWEHGYLHVPGLRLLYILPREEADRILPLQITPAPDRLVRVFVGRIEILRDSDEQQILSDITKLRGNFQPASLGRFAEPMLRRITEVAADSDVQKWLKRWIGQISTESTGTASLH